jgi:hypothetical protein
MRVGLITRSDVEGLDRAEVLQGTLVMKRPEPVVWEIPTLRVLRQGLETGLRKYLRATAPVPNLAKCGRASARPLP